MNLHFSFVILTFNEQLHLPRLLKSIKGLEAHVYILDSGSTDETLTICEEYGAQVAYHPFENHPKQWAAALKQFNIETPWTIGLDADQIVTPELFERLQNFNDADYRDTDGIYFNRKNFFKGKWLRFGGYYPKYLLKMFRTGVGKSDLNENMDHRFIVPGKTVTWKDGHILEENLKENEISFWISKHNRYSDLVAHEEIERMNAVRAQSVKRNLFGNPDERIAFLKNIWWKLPLYVRPFFYLFYRMIIKLGILDGKNGVLFHFLQGFWFRLIVDVKIDELLNKKSHIDDVKK
ncbi:glycosyltransferase [Pedobacter sp. HMF7647]|uniref:Glycosyltransferase n=1 Tax=Hufsiella arboris TaxID=2695275 RepID=A0A7K1YE05_9SPHI|nr:glycosyltransferase family 2 protein [Hufsiella arboris]MXV52812.1 glycosyltransferase [Hufsiella arboris]